VAAVDRGRGGRAGWRPIVELLDALASDAALLEESVREVRAQVPPVGRLPADDVARQTRALLAAAVRAIAERRGPTDAELAFIEQLAVVRAGQQVPIEAVLNAIHVAGRRIWAEARALAAERGITATQVLDARDLFEDWSEQVRVRLIVSHRAAELGHAASLRERRVALLRRALDGGAAGSAAVTEAGLDPTALWVVHAGTVGDDTTASRREQRLRTSVDDLFGVVDDRLVGVTAARPADEVGEDAVGVAGPVGADRLDLAARWAQLAWSVAASRDGGLVDVVSVAVGAGLVAAAPLGAHLLERCGGELAAEGAFAEVLCRTVVTHVELGADVTATAEALVVHPNTVRHRLRRFTAVTGCSTETPFGAVTAWWLARTHLDHARPDDQHERG
jgi:hypothetical protein